MKDRRDGGNKVDENLMFSRYQLLLHNATDRQRVVLHLKLFKKSFMLRTADFIMNRKYYFSNYCLVLRRWLLHPTPHPH